MNAIACFLDSARATFVASRVLISQKYRLVIAVPPSHAKKGNSGLHLVAITLIAFVVFLDVSQALADSPASAVTITSSKNSITLDNGIVSAEFNKANGNLVVFKFEGVDLLDRAGYWNIIGNIPGEADTDMKKAPSGVTITQDPKQNGGQMGEIEIELPYKPGDGSEPLDIALRYTLRRADSGLYCWTIVRHRPTYPAFNIEIALLTLKLRGDLFDHLTIDASRNREMITGDDWIHGQPLNVKEARRMTTGIHKGEVEHKYDYSAMLSQTPAYGWSSTSKNLGIWIVNPSIEYINGAPAKIELTGHIDCKDSAPADPTLLSVWHGSHYGGMPIAINAREDWTKIAGPFLLYCNTGPNPDAMWKDALERASRERHEWPYSWALAPGYANANERGSIAGQLVVRDPQQPGASPNGAWVGLAAPPYAGVDLARKPLTIDWQTDGKHYQYWTHADASGRFNISNARPGNYTLYAFKDGILGEFGHPNVHVNSGKSTDLGTLDWQPVRYGRQLWEIGVPNRSASEFLHGDQPWTWGLYNLYPRDFPNDVNYIIGTSNWSRDWNYVQPPRQDADGHWHGTAWKITFPLTQVTPGVATLRLALCGTRNTTIDLAVNGHSAGTTGPLPSTGAMHRDAMRSMEIESNLQFNKSLLLPGTNVITLTTHAKAWTDGVEYDYLRLEATDSATSSSPLDSNPSGGGVVPR